MLEVQRLGTSIEVDGEIRKDMNKYIEIFVNVRNGSEKLWKYTNSNKKIIEIAKKNVDYYKK